MKIKVDENLPAAFVSILAESGHDADSVPQEGLRGRSDGPVWVAACAAGRFMITQDLDFSDARVFIPGTHPGILLLRLWQPSRKLLIERLRQILVTVDISQWTRCLVVATDRKIRIRRP